MHCRLVHLANDQLSSCLPAGYFTMIGPDRPSDQTHHRNKTWITLSFQTGHTAEWNHQHRLTSLVIIWVMWLPPIGCFSGFFFSVFHLHFLQKHWHEAASHLSVKHDLAPVGIIIMGIKVYTLQCFVPNFLFGGKRCVFMWQLTHHLSRWGSNTAKHSPLFLFWFFTRACAKLLIHLWLKHLSRDKEERDNIADWA